MKGLPDFMIIGASRCGTTSLHMYLGEHPKTIPPALGKELTYFNLLYEESPIHWYVKCWPPHEDGLLRYEGSTDYLFHPAVPERVKFWMPDCKFIVMMRDPVKRAWSEFYNYWMKQFGTTIVEFAELPGKVTLATREAMRSPYSRRSPYRIIQKGMYAKSLKRWFRYFPKEQFLLIRSEDFFSNPWETVNQCFNFVGLERIEIPSLRVYDMLRDPGIPCPEMPEKLRTAYTDYYRPLNRELYELLDWDLGWPK